MHLTPLVESVPVDALRCVEAYITRYDPKIHTPWSLLLNGNMVAAQWLHDKGLARYGELINDAAKMGHLHIIQCAHGHCVQGWSVRTMDLAARYGHLDIVRWLHENRTEGCTTKAMDWAASRDHLDIVQWLRENRTEG